MILERFRIMQMSENGKHVFFCFSESVGTFSLLWKSAPGDATNKQRCTSQVSANNQ